MAKKRMISDSVYYSDAFIALKPLDKVLYTYLVLSADDDGMLNGVSYHMNVAGARKANLQRLVDSGFLIAFDNGIYAITHWNVMNTIKNRRPTLYNKEFQRLFLNENREYFTKESAENAGSEAFFVPSVQSSTVQSNTVQYSPVDAPLPFNSPEETETVLKKETFENYMYGKILEYARENKIQTSEASIRKFIQYNDRQVFLDMDKWQRRFVGWAKQEKNPTAIVGSEHFEHLGG